MISNLFCQKNTSFDDDFRWFSECKSPGLVVISISILFEAWIPVFIPCRCPFLASVALALLWLPPWLARAPENWQANWWTQRGKTGKNPWIFTSWRPPNKEFQHVFNHFKHILFWLPRTRVWRVWRVWSCQRDSYARQSEWFIRRSSGVELSASQLTKNVSKTVEERRIFGASLPASVSFLLGPWGHIFLIFWVFFSTMVKYIS